MGRMERMAKAKQCPEKCLRFAIRVPALIIVYFAWWLGKETTIKVICLADIYSDAIVWERYLSRWGVSQRYPGIIRECARARCNIPLHYLIIEQKFDSLDPEDMPIKTQLRLDASRRRIAEFFANVILRFVLQDLSILINKYVKRVNEWIVS